MTADRGGLIWNCLSAAYRPVGRLLYRHRTTGSVPRAGGVILVANHATMADGVWLAIIARRRVFFMANQRLFRRRLLGPFLRWIGTFPKRKFEPDVRAARTALRHCRAGAAVGLFPEACRTWDGRTARLQPGLGDLVRMAGVPVVVVRFLTGHMQSPQWARLRRWVPIVAEVSEPLRFPGDMSGEAIESAIAARLAIDPAVLPAPRGSVGLGLALGLPDYLWACPACRARATLRARGLLRNRIGCASCGAEWRVRLDLGLDAQVPGCRSLHIGEASRDLVEHHLSPLATGGPRVHQLGGLSWESEAGTLGNPAVPASLAIHDGIAHLETAENDKLVLPLADLDACFLQGSALVVVGRAGKWTLHCRPADRVMLWQLLDAARKRSVGTSP